MVHQMAVAARAIGGSGCPAPSQVARLFRASVTSDESVESGRSQVDHPGRSA